MTRVHTHYDNLRVSRNAPPEVIKAAYRALSQRYHPDKNSSPDATRIMKILNDAYATLGDPEARRRYDEAIAEERTDSKDEAPTTSDRKASTDSDPTASDRKASTDSDPTASDRKASNNSDREAPTPNRQPKSLLILGGLLCAAFLIRGVVAVSSNADATRYPAPSIVAPTSSELNAPPARMEPIITSFDCNKARSISEKLICGDADLAAMDRDLAVNFARAKAAAPDKRTFTEIARQNWNWRNKNCTDKACLVSWYVNQQSWLLEILNSPPQTIVNNQAPTTQAPQAPQATQTTQAAQVDTKAATYVPTNRIDSPVTRQDREECLKTAAPTVEGVGACL